MTTPILAIKNLTKTYRSKDETKTAVSSISLAIPAGSFFGLLGPNGAGKSTLIHCITGISQPTSGQILIDNIDVVSDYKAARRLVGLSPQEANVDVFSTAEELLDFMGGYYGLPKDIRKQRIDELIKQFDLEAHRHFRFQKLSGGLKRRVMLGRAMIHSPKLLILDEPTAGVDVKQRHDLWQYLQEINQQGTTIILTSHYLEEVQHLCRDIAIISDGHIIAQGSKADFTKNGQSLEEAYLNITNANSKN